ncbi:MAG: hypothetical protein GF383_16805 [Candidatus Lokiarchaeota archaeon]|nr:hypothetical protein [Candidatus Lokiarchaeota archaeon]
MNQKVENVYQFIKKRIKSRSYSDVELKWHISKFVTAYEAKGAFSSVKKYRKLFVRQETYADEYQKEQLDNLPEIEYGTALQVVKIIKVLGMKIDDMRDIAHFEHCLTNSINNVETNLKGILWKKCSSNANQ